MKLTLRQQWRPRPLISFLGVLDIKIGVIIALLFALLNKVAGVYGLLAMLTGAGASAAQVSLYVYSTAALGIDRRKGCFYGPPAYSPTLASLLYYARLLLFESALPAARRRDYADPYGRLIDVYYR